MPVKGAQETLGQNIAPSRIDNLVRAFELFRKRLLAGLESVTPAIVVEYDRDTHVAVVQPLCNIQDGYGGSVKQAQIKVTVKRMYCGDYLIDIPIHKDDTGWVVSADMETTNVKSNNPNKFGVNIGTQEPVTGDMHKHWMGYFIPDRWGDAYMPIEEADKSHITDFVDTTAKKKSAAQSSDAQQEEEETYYGDIEKSPQQFFTKYKTVGMLADRAKDDLAEIPQPDGKGGLIDPPIGGTVAREFNTDYDRLVIQSKDKKQRITMSQKDIKVYSSNLIYVNSQKDIIAYARDNVDVHVGEKLNGADTTEGKINVYSNKDIKVTCASVKKDAVIDVCSDNKMLVHSPEITIDGDSPLVADPQLGERVDKTAKTETMATNIKVHANNINIACTMNPDSKGVAGTGKVCVSAITQVDVHSPIVNIDGGTPNPTKPATGDPISGKPGIVNIKGVVNVEGAINVTGTGTVTALNEVTAKTINLTTHIHPENDNGGPTGVPVP